VSGNVLRLAHLADVHLGATPYNLEWRARDILESLMEAVEKILEERVDLVVVAGDFFDRPRPDNRVILEAINALRPLAERGVPVVFAYGEHDYPKTRDRTAVEIVAEALKGRLYAPPRPRVSRDAGGRYSVANLEDYVVRMDGALVTVTPFLLGNPRTRRELLLDTVYPKYASLAERHGGPVIHVAHLTLEHVFPHGDLVVPIARMPPATYTALGHLHWRVVDTGGEKPYAYPGSLEPLKMGEAERRLRDECMSGFLLVDIAGRDGVSNVETVCIESARPQLVVRSGLHELRSRIRTQLLQRRLAGRRKNPLVYLILEVPPGARPPLQSQLSRILRSLRDELKIEIHLKIERLGEEKPGGPPLSGGEGGEGLDVREILMELMGVEGRKGLMLAEEILQLKEALLSDDAGAIEESLRNVLRFADLVEHSRRGR